ncbi:MAG: hypothetical protein MZW92_19865 [Comamonadaceae bacterium]|nr:hypothetical protein [Comamonadaceae bacterium]
MKTIGHCREAIRGAGHRARASPRWRASSRSTTTTSRTSSTWSPSAVGHLVEIAGARRVRRQARQVELRPPAGDPAALRPRADRQGQGAPERGWSSWSSARTSTRTDQRLRRRARGRADLPPDRAVRQQLPRPSKPVAAAVAAVDDAGGHPRRLRAAAQRRADAAAGRRRAQPLRGRLAGRHQRHARDDRLQHASDGGFFLTTVGRVQTPTLAIVVEREEKIRALRAARLLGSARHLRPQGRRVRRASWFDPTFKKPERRRARARRAALEPGARPQAIVDAVRGKAGSGHRGGQAQHAGQRRCCST